MVSFMGLKENRKRERLREKEKNTKEARKTRKIKRKEGNNKRIIKRMRRE
jgi:hypothetical protein